MPLLRMRFCLLLDRILILRHPDSEVHTFVSTREYGDVQLPALIVLPRLPVLLVIGIIVICRDPIAVTGRVGAVN